MISNDRLSKILRESIDRLLTESIPSERLSNFFSQHGGVNRQYPQDGLGDVTDDQIVSMYTYDTIHDAENSAWKMRRNPKYREFFPCVYTANDGTSVVTLFDRNKVKTGHNWGGEHFKKFSDRIWRDDHDPNAKNQKNDVYYYGGGEHVPTNDFGLRTNTNYRGRLEDIENTRERYKDYYTPKAPRDDRGKFEKFFGLNRPKNPTRDEIDAGRQKGEEAFNTLRKNAEKDRKDYLNRHYKWHRRDFTKDKPREW